MRTRLGNQTDTSTQLPSSIQNVYFRANHPQAKTIEITMVIKKRPLPSKKRTIYKRNSNTTLSLSKKTKTYTGEYTAETFKHTNFFTYLSLFLEKKQLYIYKFTRSTTNRRNTRNVDMQHSKMKRKSLLQKGHCIVCDC